MVQNGSNVPVNNGHTFNSLVRQLLIKMENKECVLTNI